MESGRWPGVFFNQGVDDICGPQWYGWNGNAEVGSISTMLYKTSKCGKLDFGNCWTTGTVRVYLAGELIGEAGPNTPSQIIEFAIPENSQLEFKDEGANSVIKFTNFEMVDCTTTTIATTPTTPTTGGMYSDSYILFIFLLLSTTKIVFYSDNNEHISKGSPFLSFFI